ncbi:MAG: SDR family NAD(P)-dependent oxidoreductase [Planctomycetota bacterium]
MSVLDRFRLHQKRLFITGGSRGLGREMAIACAEAGADVVLVGREEGTLAATAEEIRGCGRQADVIVGDVSDPERCEAICKLALEQFGPIHIVINNVGGRRQNIPTEEMSIENWRQLLDLNLTSVVICTRVLGGAMLQRGEGGRIINIASINALVAGRGIAGRHYETAKAAIVQFTRAVAADWAPHHITVNAILPGGFMTDPNIRWSQLHPEVITKFKSNIPMGDFGRPEDLGPLAVYLASDASRYMTGASLVIDGGYTLW